MKPRILLSLLIVLMTQARESPTPGTSSATFRIPLPKKTVLLTINNTVQGRNENTVTQMNTTNSCQRHHQKPISTPSAGLLNIFPRYRHNKVYAAIAVAGAIYGTLAGAMHYQANAITNNNSWGLWHSEIPLAALLELQHTDLVQELRRAVKERYLTNNTDQVEIDAIYHFMHDTKKEMQQCALFIEFYGWIDHLHLALLFPSHKLAREQAHITLERLSLLRQRLDQSIQTIV